MPAACSRGVVGGADVAFDVSGALWVPGERALILSDLHLEKGSAFAAKGVPLPPYDTRATLSRLADVIDRIAPDRVVSLGDSFHDATCEARMASSDLSALASLVARVDDWVWIAGNHDPAPPARHGGRVCDELRLGPLTLRHEPATGSARGEIAGHFHPCASVRRRGRAVRRPCFVTDGERLVMPAFGAFTGGLDVREEPIEALFPAGGVVAHMLGRDRVWPVPVRRLSRR